MKESRDSDRRLAQNISENPEKKKEKKEEKEEPRLIARYLAWVAAHHVAWPGLRTAVLPSFFFFGFFSDLICFGCGLCCL